MYIYNFLDFLNHLPKKQNKQKQKYVEVRVAGLNDINFKKYPVCGVFKQKWWITSGLNFTYN